MGEYVYDAFISYRHKAPDDAQAKAIHRCIEGYRVPGYIAKRSGKRRMGKVFRDRDELPLMADLGEGIRRALEESEWLIAICSPEYPKSKWCMLEIDYFISLGRRDRILTVLTAGEPSESFPPQLRFLEVNGEAVEREPLAADIRAESARASLKKVRNEKLRLLAPMLGVGFDDLKRRARERFFRLTASVSLAAALFFAGFGIFAVSQAMTISRQNDALVIQRNIADENAAEAERQAKAARESQLLAEENQALAERNEAEAVRQEGLAQEARKLAEDNAAEAKAQKNIAVANEAEAQAQRKIAVENEAVAVARGDEIASRQSKVYAGFARDLLAQGNRAGAALLAVEALKASYSQEAKNAVYEAAYREYAGFEPLMQVSGNGDSVPAPDGKTFAATDAEFSRVYDAQTFRLIYEHPGAFTTVQVFEPSEGGEGAAVKRPVYSKDGGRVFLPNGNPVLVDAHTGEVIQNGPFTDADELAAFGLSRYTCVMPYDRDSRRVVDLKTGETVFKPETEHSTSKSLFSPDGKYYMIATYAGCWLYDIETGQVVNERLSDEKLMVKRGFTFFSPDSRHLVLTRQDNGRFSVEGHGDETAPGHEYAIQVLEIPSMRVIYETAFLLYPNWDSDMWLPNDYHIDDSDMAEYLFARDGSKLILPTGSRQLGVFDFATEKMLFTKSGELPFFASFSFSGESIMTVSKNGHNVSVLNAVTGASVTSLYKADGAFTRGYVLPGEETVLLSGGGYCGLYALNKPKPALGIAYFNDDSGRYVRPAEDGAAAAVVNARTGAAVALESSSKYTNADAFAASGDLAVGRSNQGTESVLTSWDANTGKRLADFAYPEYMFSAHGFISPSFRISYDGSRVVAFYQLIGIASGGFRVYDAKTGEVIAENNLGPLNYMKVSLDNNLTKLVTVYDNIVTVYDLRTGRELYALDDYPAGSQALGIWSGQKAAVSRDGKLLAVSHAKKGTLEIIDANTGKRRFEVPIGGQATTAPCFSPNGDRAVIGAGKYLFSVSAVTGKALFACYDEAGFRADCTFSEDGRYLLGADIRNAGTGEVVCPVPLEASPIWEAADAPGVKIPVGSARAVYLPTIDEATAAALGRAAAYAFTDADKLSFVLK